MASVCVITRMRNDEFFLKKFISYYGEQLGEENIYVYLDGFDQTLNIDIGRINLISCERILGTVVSTDKQRISFLSDRAAELFDKYDLVIGVDVDEFLVVDPSLNISLKDYLSTLKINTSVSGLGLDIGQHMEEEVALDLSKPFMQQRSYALVCEKYTKPSVLNRKARWGSGFHRVLGHNYHIDPNLYLFHLGCVDMEVIKGRLSDKDRLELGWSKHSKKRVLTIDKITNLKAKNGEMYFSKVRLIQTIFRRFFTWNKPSMLGWNLVIKIPPRFRNVL